MVSRRFVVIAIGLLVAVSMSAGCSGGDDSQEQGQGGRGDGGSSGRPVLPTLHGGGGTLATVPAGGGTLPTIDGAGPDDYTPPPTDPPPSPTSAPPTTTTTTTAPPPEVLSGDVAFDTASAELKAGAVPVLQRIARRIRNEYPPSAYIRIVGHTDSRGSADANQDLSQRRALAVKLWFVRNGFAEGRLSARGAGESDLLQPDFDSGGNFIESAGQRNRRVEIQVFR